MMNKILTCLVMLMVVSYVTQAQEKKILEVVDEDGKVKEYEIDWPSGPPSTGSSEAIRAKVDKILVDNNIECPPKREKVSDNIWKCGNGKKIRTKDSMLALLLSKAWD